METITSQLYSALVRLNTLFTSLIIILINAFRPILGPASCKFPETCTPYAIRQLQEKNLLRATISIIKRLIACSPFSR